MKENVVKDRVITKVSINAGVIPVRHSVKTGIECFKGVLDVPVSGTGGAPQVRHDE
jgi:hypothetical protein